MRIRTAGTTVLLAASATLFTGAPMAHAAAADAACSSQAAAFTYYRAASGTFVVTITNCSYYTQTLGVNVADSTGEVIGIQGCGSIPGKGSRTRNIGFRPVSVTRC